MFEKPIFTNIWQYRTDFLSIFKYPGKTIDTKVSHPRPLHGLMSYIYYAEIRSTFELFDGNKDGSCPWHLL